MVTLVQSVKCVSFFHVNENALNFHLKVRTCAWVKCGATQI